MQVGARGTGSARISDYRDAQASGVTFIMAREVAAQGIRAAIEAIPTGANLIITLDCDGLDPSIIPGVIGPAPGGLTYWQTIELLHGAAQRAGSSLSTWLSIIPIATSSSKVRLSRDGWLRMLSA